jgi:hypothetical protein
MIRLLTIGALAAAALLATQPASAQDVELREFCADRPGKGTPTCILDTGRVQLEVGLFDYGRQSGDGARTESRGYADTWIRYGLAEKTEIQVGFTPYVSEETRAGGVTDKVDGFSDLTLGFRHSLANPDGSGLSVALAGFAALPTGTDAVSEGAASYGLVLPVSVPLNEDWSLSLSPEVDWAPDADGDGSHPAYALVAGVGRGFGPWALGAEIWVAHDDDPMGGVTQSTFDLTAVWTPPFLADAQLDFGLNFGLNNDSPDIEFGVGVARRF